MKVSGKRVLFLLAITAALAVVSFAVFPDSPKSGLYASTLDDSEQVMGGGGSCPKTRCVTWCWVSGCEKNNPNMTRCRKTVMEPLKCPTGTGGCLAEAC